MISRTVLAAIHMFAIACGTIQAQAPKSFVSPDGKLTAVIMWAPKETGRNAIESRVESYNQEGKLLGTRDYSSVDGEHGFEVLNAAWTADSQFFLYTMKSSGGHQPWHSPVEFFATTDNKFRSLDKALHDAVTDPYFEVTTRDAVTVSVLSQKRKVTISMRKVMSHVK